MAQGFCCEFLIWVFSMKKKTIIDKLSIGVSHPIKMLGPVGSLIAVGTAFFYSVGDGLYLITAGHNVTGKNPDTNTIMGIPEKLVVMLYKVKNDILVGFEEFNVDLYDHDGNPEWFQHPTHGEIVDIVAIPIVIDESLSEVEVNPINKIHFDNDLPLDVGMDVFILGYPHGYVPYPTITPIWKKGSLATEFDIDIGRLPKVYIDSSTAKGMSGSPVIACQSGYFPEGKEKILANYVFSKGRRFLGIYTGRYADEITEDLRSSIFNAQLGITWKYTEIEKIVSASG